MEPVIPRQLGIRAISVLIMGGVPFKECKFTASDKHFRCRKFILQRKFMSTTAWLSGLIKIVSFTRPTKIYWSSLVPLQPILLQHQARLHWRKAANLPVEMDRPQVVVVGERVYMGGGATDSHDDFFLVFQYNPVSDEWTSLPPCPVCGFSLGQLSGELLTVGGLARDGVTNKVYHYKPESQQWEEFLQPMPTARYFPTVISAQSALTACGGHTHTSGVPCTTVEVYSRETSQWHATDPLSVPCWMMSSATINNTTYLLGGLTTDNKPTKTVLYAPVASLIQRATSHPKQSASVARPDSTSSAWKTLQDTPLEKSAAASLGGMLLAVRGKDDWGKALPAVHVYYPATSTWIRVQSGDLPEPQYFSTTVELAGNRLLVVGGKDQDGKKMNTVLLGSLISV